MTIRTAGSPRLWESALDDLSLEPGEELMALVSDHAEAKGLSAPHAMVITDKRLVAISRPPLLSLLFPAPRESLSIGYANRREVQLKVSGPTAGKRRRVRLQWIDVPDDDTYVALRGMISGEKPSFARGQLRPLA
jgi:hypothetical protein